MEKAEKIWNTENLPGNYSDDLLTDEFFWATFMNQETDTLQQTGSIQRKLLWHCQEMQSYLYCLK